MNPYLIIVGLPLVCSIVGAIYIWNTPRYAAKPLPNMEWRTEKPLPRVEVDAETEDVNAIAA
jgi:hypothetical protein